MISSLTYSRSGGVLLQGGATGQPDVRAGGAVPRLSGRHLRVVRNASELIAHVGAGGGRPGLLHGRDASGRPPYEPPGPPDGPWGAGWAGEEPEDGPRRAVVLAEAREAAAMLPGADPMRADLEAALARQDVAALPELTELAWMRISVDAHIAAQARFGLPATDFGRDGRSVDARVYGDTPVIAGVRLPDPMNEDWPGLFGAPLLSGTHEVDGARLSCLNTNISGSHVIDGIPCRDGRPLLPIVTIALGGDADLHPYRPVGERRAAEVTDYVSGYLLGDARMRVLAAALVAHGLEVTGELRLPVDAATRAVLNDGAAPHETPLFAEAAWALRAATGREADAARLEAHPLGGRLLVVEVG